jgi:hypothetical protein
MSKGNFIKDKINLLQIFQHLRANTTFNIRAIGNGIGIYVDQKLNAKVFIGNRQALEEGCRPESKAKPC